MPVLPLGIPPDLEKFFYNRERELKELETFLKGLYENVSRQILITGYRGVGKTYLLKKLLKDLPEDIFTVYIDISKIYGIQKGKITEEQILRNLLSSINSSIKEIDTGIIKQSYNAVNTVLNELRLKKYNFKAAGRILGISIPEIEDNYEKLSHLVMELPQKIVESSEDKIRGFVIVIDEFQLIGQLENPDAFFWMIRSYNQEQDKVDYIFTGSTSTTSEIVEKINGAQGAFGGRMIQFNVEPFSREKTQSYLEEKVSEIRFTEDGFERFYECTRGIPAYLNSFCNTLSENETYDAEKVKETFLEKMDQIAVMWIRIWGTLSVNERDIIRTLVENGPLSWSELDGQVEFSKGTLAKYLDVLKNKGIISLDTNRKYIIEDIMLKTWLKHRKEIDGYYPP